MFLTFENICQLTFEHLATFLKHIQNGGLTSLPAPPEPDTSLKTITQELSQVVFVLSVLQRVAACCTVGWCVAQPSRKTVTQEVSQVVSVFSVLRWVAVRRSVLQCVAICCSVLHSLHSKPSRRNYTGTADCLCSIQ